MHDFKAISNMLSSFAMKGQDLARAGTGIQNNANFAGPIIKKVLIPMPVKNLLFKMPSLDPNDLQDAETTANITIIHPKTIYPNLLRRVTQNELQLCTRST